SGTYLPARRARLWTCVTLMCCLAVHSIRAELPLTRLFSIFPPGGKAGSTVEVTVNGADLDEAAQFLFSSTNITASPKPGEPNKFLITVASNAAPGVYDARLAGRFGVSNPRGFVVGDWPELVE